MNWGDLWAAIALLLVLEGLLPFLSPPFYKRNLAQLLQLPDRTLRLLGLGSMGLGLVLLYVVRG